MDWHVIAAVLGSMIAVGGVLAAVGRERTVRPWAMVAALSVAAMPVAIVLHNLLSALIGGEEAISFVAALVVAPLGFAVGTLGAGIAVARGGRRWETGASLAIAGAGMLLFGAYGLFALIVTTLEGGNPPYQAAVEAVVLPVAVVALVGGAVSAVFSLVVRPLYALRPRRR